MLLPGETRACLLNVVTATRLTLDAHMDTADCCSVWWTLMKPSIW